MKIWRHTLAFGGMFLLVALVTLPASGQGSPGIGQRLKLFKELAENMFGVPEPFTPLEMRRVLYSANFLSEKINLLRMTGVDEGQPFHGNTSQLFPAIANERLKNHTFDYVITDVDPGILTLNIVAYESRRQLAIITPGLDFYTTQLGFLDQELNDILPSVSPAELSDIRKSASFAILSPFCTRLFYEGSGYFEQGYSRLQNWRFDRIYVDRSEKDQPILLFALRYALVESFQDTIGQKELYGFIAMKIDSGDEDS